MLLVLSAVVTIILKILGYPGPGILLALGTITASGLIWQLLSLLNREL